MVKHYWCLLKQERAIFLLGLVLSIVTTFAGIALLAVSGWFIRAVLDAHGVVGQVIRALPLSSEVMLITDPEHAIPVQVNRNGLRTIAIGTGRLDQLSLPFLPNNADIRAGDLLVTSGLGGTFPQGYPVAIVDHLTVQPDKPFAEISATPKALLDRSRELLIVWTDATPVPLSETQGVPGDDLK